MKHVCNTTPTPPPGPASPAEAEIINRMISGLDQPDARIERILIGNTLVAVQAGGRLGLASHLRAQPEKGEENLTERFNGATCAEAARLMLAEGTLSVAIGMAALNAGLLPADAVPEKRPIQQVVADLSRAGETALVGKFPFAGWLREHVETLHLFELQQVDARVPRDQWEQVLAQVQVAAITSTVFLTRFAAFYLQRLSHSTCVMIGPSTPLSKTLFDFGVDILAGSRVTDPEKVMHSMTTRGCYSEVAAAGGIEFVVMKRPGL